MHSQDFPWARFYNLGYPVQFDELGDVLEEIWASHSPRRNEGSVNSSTTCMVGKSADIEATRQLIERVAPSMATVLITGESGTGKEVVAQSIHDQSGRDGPFVAINCGAIPDHLLESELFGHERGAFTGAVAARKGRFEQARGGTLFLDEIGDMPSGMQVKILRVLQERVLERVGGSKSISVDIRVIAATHRNLLECIDDGGFREDLFYRLSVFPIDISPLRDRPDDVEPLIEEMIRRVQSSHRVKLHFAEDAVALLKQYEWPGNVRELSNLIERLAVIKPNSKICAADLPPPLRPVSEEPVVLSNTLVATSTNTDSAFPDDGMDLKAHLANIEKQMIASALEQSEGIVQKAAELLGLGRTTLVEKIRRHELRASS